VPAALLGSWSATRWQYSKRDDPVRSVDVVCDLGGAVTLSLSARTYVLTRDVAGRGTTSEGGACDLLDDQLHLTPEGADRSNAVWFQVAADTLSLRADTAAWDFDGDSDDAPADFVAVLVGL